MLSTRRFTGYICILAGSFFLAMGFLIGIPGAVKVFAFTGSLFVAAGIFVLLIGLPKSSGS